MKSLLLAATVVTAMTIGSTSALAHGDAAVNAQKATNGGQVRPAGPWHVELVIARDATEARESPLLVYVTDHDGKRIPTVGASGTVTILAGKTKVSAALSPDGDNRLKGAARYAASPDMKVIVAVTLAGKSTEQARFTPLAAGDGHTDHKH